MSVDRFIQNVDKFLEKYRNDRYLIEDCNFLLLNLIHVLIAESYLNDTVTDSVLYAKLEEIENRKP